MALQLDDRQRAILREMGVRVWLPGTAFAPNEEVSAVPVPSSVLAAVEPGSGSEPQDSIVRTAGPDWDALVHAAASCQACGLCAGRKQATLRAPLDTGPVDWMVVGDPPDDDEDRLGTAFVEQAGGLLDNMLKAVRVSRKGTGANGAYLTNVVKCRPPMGRLPQAGEIAACAGFLRREIEVVQPKVILAMGRFALQALMIEHAEQAALPLGKQRGRVYRYGSIPVVVTYHPQVLLRASADKAKAWADLCLAVQVVRDAGACLQSPP